MGKLLTGVPAMATVRALHAERSQRSKMGKSAPPRRITRQAAGQKRDYLTPDEVERLAKAAGAVGRHGHRDATIILIMFRHGLRVSEAAVLHWDDIDLKRGCASMIASTRC